MLGEHSYRPCVRVCVRVCASEPAICNVLHKVGEEAHPSFAVQE